MWRGAFLTVMLLLALAPAVAAQEEPATAPEPEPTPATGCERGPGTDADYADCPDTRRCDEGGTDADYVYGCCGDLDGTDADYVYACRASGGGGGPTSSRPPPRPRAAVQALGNVRTLPLTGSEPLLIALAGGGFLLAGAGLRLRVT